MAPVFFGRWLFLILALFIPDRLFALEFTVIGGRAAGMGGAGVAITTDALATYWNPAGLAMDPGTDLRIHGGGAATDRLGIFDLIRETKSIQDAEALAETDQGLQQLMSLLDRLRQPGASASGTVSAGIHVKTNSGNHAFGFHVMDIAHAGGFFTPDTVPENTLVTGRGLEARQLALAYAYASPNRTFSAGTTVKLIQGVTYSNSMTVQAVDSSIVTDAPTHSSLAMGIDAGLMYRPTSWLQFGMVGRDLNTPSFKAPEGGHYLLEPQFRGGMAVKPYASLLMTADVDLIKNRTLVPSIKSQALSLGAEQSFFENAFFVRGGAIRNMADASSIVMPTVGFGFRGERVQFDIGGGYDFRERQAMASFTFGMTF